MKNITFDSTSFSEQLGIYDFFNVILSGAIFICGLCIINQNINSFVWSNISLQKGLGLILLIYILGMILQEAGSVVDRNIFKIYKGMNQSILMGRIYGEYEEKTTNEIIENPIVLERYRRSADKLLTEFALDKDEKRFDNKYANGYVFSVCQYYVSVYGKDKKVEKLRALFAMSKTFMSCFFLLSACALLSIFTNAEPSVNICDLSGISNLGCKVCANKMVLSIVFAVIGIFFVFRAKRVMKNFLLILLGTYDAIVRAAENNEIEYEIKGLSLDEKE